MITFNVVAGIASIVGLVVSIVSLIVSGCTLYKVGNLNNSQTKNKIKNTKIEGSYTGHDRNEYSE